jgi:hypothetical protein
MKHNPIQLFGVSLFGLLALVSVSYGDTYFNNGVLSAAAGSPTAHATGQSTAGTAMQYYNLYSISVLTTGTYTFELASPNTSGTPSNALDTWLGIFTNTFVPPNPGAPTISSDDFTGALTVLPGPYSGTITATSTGFTGAQPGSRIAGFNLLAGTTYFIYVSGFRDTSFVGTGTNGQPTGPYYLGVGGTGSIAVTPIVQTVPEPSTLSILGLSGLGAVAWNFWRKRRTS